MKTASHILVGTDLSPASDSALEYAASLASTLGARLTVVYALETPYPYPVPLPPERIGRVRMELERKLQALSSRPSHVTALVREGPACVELLAVAQEAGADLIVVGTHGRGGVSRVLLGSVAERVVRLSPVPVITVRSDFASVAQGQKTLNYC